MTDKNKTTEMAASGPNWLPPSGSGADTVRIVATFHIGGDQQILLEVKDPEVIAEIQKEADQKEHPMDGYAHLCRELWKYLCDDVTVDIYNSAIHTNLPNVELSCAAEQPKKGKNTNEG